MSSAQTITANWGIPNRMLVGPGRLQELPSLCEELGYKSPLLVTDKGLKDLPMITETLALLKNAGLGVDLFADVAGNPVESSVSAGVEVYRTGQHDSVIAFGGGSALDVGKAIAFMSGQTRPIWDFEDIGDYWKRADVNGIAPVIAVPTTAGTGSEVGRASVISNEQEHRKVIVFHPKMLPVAVILDPEVTVALPPPITAATGLDAFIHCFEAYCAPGFHPIAEGIALQGMRLIAEALPVAYEDGADLVARTHMLAAASMGAISFQKGLGGVHAIAHAVGAMYNTHHGLTNAILLPYVMKHNQSAIEHRMTPVAQAIGLQDTSFESVLAWVLEFRRQLGIPHTLRDIDVAADQAEAVGELAAGDPSAGGNPTPVNAEDLTQVFRNAVNGII
ncbi:alcohol dehydrogenase [Hahella sp. CCB-MM4]|uniref:iron-containing alcohol dehydrogenase n=1 Tax=Hahella sp. (strain CCB-MM4) TaxID=1926491 RepID=UPI000B9A8181|nr:iron-containing alcohol dehydrogenase [Hahella sp. CCB-MM4]OZG73916.1 alcohol dehydrogenase [Hahella sp. CCB-MM4]